MKQAYIVKAFRTAVGKAPKGVFRFKRADELGSETIKYMMNELPDLDVNRIDDVIVGNAMPEGSQGLNMARFISLIGLRVTSHTFGALPRGGMRVFKVVHEHFI